MKVNFIYLMVTTLFMTAFSAKADDAAVEALMQTYRSQGATVANAKRGEIFWNKTFSGNAPDSERSCKTCHGVNLKKTGKHIKTGKIIKPLAPSVNAESLTDTVKIEKWFKRNCKWTTGNECSAQIKTDTLAFISQQ